jgi:hypothetical protein
MTALAAIVMPMGLEGPVHPKKALVMKGFRKNGVPEKDSVDIPLSNHGTLTQKRVKQRPAPPFPAKCASSR